MNNYDYPLGADNIDAPWNEKELPSRKIEVLVSLTLSKVMIIETSKEDLTESNLLEAVRAQHILPDEAMNYIGEDKVDKEEFSNWDIDDIAVQLN